MYLIGGKMGGCVNRAFLAGMWRNMGKSALILIFLLFFYKVAKEEGRFGLKSDPSCPYCNATLRKVDNRLRCVGCGEVFKANRALEGDRD